MKTRNLTPFPFATRVTSRRPPRREMTMIVRATYVLAPGQPLALPETPGLGPDLVSQGPLTAETYSDDDEERAGECLYPGDFADWKPRADVMLRGTCHTPGGKPLTECPVRFEVGDWSKVLRVVGRRFWSDDGAGAVMSETAPFTKMPVGWAQAFGGPGYAENPAGKGFAGRELPNVEHAGRVIQRRRDDPGPAGLAPLPPAWALRAGKLGKQYDRRWRKERWPYYPEDFDWSHFNAAPADQQIQGYLRGDERVLVQGFHPGENVLETRLPGLRIRAFVMDVQRRFREVTMSLDTLFVDADAGRLWLTWRGLDAIETDDMKDVETVLVASEKIGEAPSPREHYERLLADFEADPLGIKDHVPAEVRETLAAMEERAAGKKPAPAEPAPDPVTANLRRLLDMMPAPFAGAKDVEKKVADAVAGALKKAPPSAGLQQKMTEMAAEAAKSLARPRSAPVIPLRPGGPPPAWAQKALEKALAGVDETSRSLAQHKPPGDAGADVDRRLAELARRREALQKEPFFQSILSRPPRREPGPGEDLSGQDYEGRDLSGADLRGANLRDANLAGANLRGARLAGACLEGAVLVDADLAGADLTGADLTLANLTGARAAGAVLREARLDRAFFQGADLSGAVLAGANGQYTFLPEVNLSGADCKGLSLSDGLLRGAACAGADFSGATLVRCHLLDADAKKATFSRATLTRTSFAGADLSQATFRDAIAERSSWLRAKLADADFTRAVLTSAFFVEASAPRACFRRAILKDVQCYRAALDQADFTESNLLRADLSKCTVSGARFKGANLYDAKLLQMAGEGCDFSGANLKRATRPEP